MQLPNTNRNIVRKEIGPKPINKYDRQQINQYMENLNLQNKILKQNIIQVNSKMKQLLKQGPGQLAPICEVANEQSESLSLSMQLAVYQNIKQQLVNSNDDYKFDRSSLSFGSFLKELSSNQYSNGNNGKNLSLVKSDLSAAINKSLDKPSMRPSSKISYGSESQNH